MNMHIFMNTFGKWSIIIVEREGARITPLLHVQAAVCRRQCVQCEYARYSAVPGQQTSPCTTFLKIAVRDFITN